jgi:hypothetical protein
MRVGSIATGARVFVSLVSLASLAALVVACSSSEPAAPSDAGLDAPFAVPDSSGAAHLDAGELADTTPGPRVTKHAGDILPAMRLFAIYVTVPSADGGTSEAPNEDAAMTWLLSSAGYWGRLAEYGVHDGTLLGSTAVPLGAIVPPNKVSSGIIGQKDFADGVAHFLHPSPGVDAGVNVPAADAYAFFLPDNVNIVLPANQGTTCITVAAYHDDDGIEPFALFPPCGAGRSVKALSHELAETATDPFGRGWYSDADYANGGGEIGDICDQPVAVEGHVVASFWSDAAGGCVP